MIHTTMHWENHQDLHVDILQLFNTIEVGTYVITVYNGYCAEILQSDNNLKANNIYNDNNWMKA